jgi:hypothetical protein
VRLGEQVADVPAQLATIAVRADQSNALIRGRIAA